MEKKTFTAFFVLFASCLELFAARIEETVPENFLAALLQERNVSVIHDEDDETLSLVPECGFKNEITSGRIEKKDSPYTAEFLYLISKKDLVQNGKKKTDGITMGDISEVFTSLSLMSGMRFRFTESNPEGAVLYKKVRTVDGAGNKKEIPDAVSRNCDGMKLFCYQHDRLLGGLYFFLDYRMNGDELFLSILNENNLGLLGFKACRKENLRINIHVTDLGEDVLFYISADANYENVLRMFSIRKVIKKLMNERLDAIYRWFFIQF